MIIVFFGPPGSGKGTQAQELKKNVQDLVHISTGDLLRQEIASGSELGRSIRSTIEAGGFVTDEVILALIPKIVHQNAEKDMIFDGFPRTLNQAIAFDALLGVENLKVNVVLDFDIDMHVLIERVSGRFTCSECGAVYHEKTKKPQLDGICDQCGGKHFDKREDDTAAVLEKRIKIYQECTLPIKEYYGKKGILKRIDASCAFPEVTRLIKTALSEAGFVRRGE